jgi:hypothetical protein
MPANEGWEAAITSMWSEFEETMKNGVEGAQVTVALNGHAYEQNIATAWSVYNIDPATSAPKVKCVVTRQLQLQQQQQAPVVAARGGAGWLRRSNVVMEVRRQ